MLFCGPLKKLRSEIISCICDRAVYSRNGKENFDGFSH